VSFYIHDGSTSFRFEIEGSLTANEALQVDQAWRTASSVIGSRALVVVLGNITDIDPFGRELLARFHEADAQFVATSPAAETLVSSITGQHVTPVAKSIRAGRGWFRARVLPMVPLIVFFLTGTANGAVLEKATSKTWSDYIESVRMRVEERMRSGNGFLWVDEEPKRLETVHAGEIIVAPLGLQNPRRIESGLIHDWIGAMFIANTTLKQTLLVVRDYSRYKELYQPTVVGSKVLATGETKDRFWTLLVNTTWLPRTALDIDYESHFVHVDDRHVYSVSRTTRVQEIEQYGTVGQRFLREGQGKGFIWRLFSIERFVERDGGVYVEIEAIGLSRDIPASLRWIVEPIVRHVSRGSLILSLEQTANAIRSPESVATSTSRTIVISRRDAR
jgi:hypothetical protein